MYSPRKSLATPQDFDFPYEPYNIQQKLMEELYDTLEKKHIGIFESPTGTGKSLTLTCAAIRWLKDHKALVKQDLQQRIGELQRETTELGVHENKSVDWINSQYAILQQKNQLINLRNINNQLEDYDQKVNEITTRKLKLTSKKEVKKNITDFSYQAMDLKQHDILDNTLIADICNKPENENYSDIKIYFCSRTHTQLSQVVREIKRSSYGNHIRCISLASRQQLCINKEVRKLKNINLINERCLEMAGVESEKCIENERSKKKRRTNETLSKCPYKSVIGTQKLSETSLSNVLDIEDLVREAESMKSCPYYASRRATQLAEVVMLPYQMLLHRRTRLQNDINLKGSIVIIDEAHNLLDTLTQMYTYELSLNQLVLVQQQIYCYKMHYGNMFSSTNLLNINQLLYIIKRLTKILNDAKINNILKTRVLRTYELAAEGDFFNINLVKLIDFCERTRFSQKLQAFSMRLQKEPQPNENQSPKRTRTLPTVKYLQKLEEDKYQREKKQLKLNLENTEDLHKNQDNGQVSSTSPLRAFIVFLEALTEDAEHGRVLVKIEPGSDTKQIFLKYILLNPAGQFKEILCEARSIIIAGGTMQPTKELVQQLFSSCTERVKEFFYDHVVPTNAVSPFAVTHGPTGKKLCFSYSQRSDEEMLNELSMILRNLCNVVPSGVVCFLSSYKYLDEVYDYLKRKNVLSDISDKKQVLRECSGNSQSVETLLRKYAEAVHTGNGALLLSVVGGKLSEGLNFADNLGRGVIVVGLPYSNRSSPELEEKMKYLDLSLGVGAGDEYYENLCMKAVNQCIGRSVRHIHDYACVYLLDNRFSSERIQRKLPHWISRNLSIANNFGFVQSTTAKFFKSK